MLTKRIIPCLDVRNGRTVKGIQFEGLVDAGDPVALARRYVEEGADELVLLDITATIEGRRAFAATVAGVARQLNIPFTVGGGIGSLDDALAMLDAGADKIAVNSAALRQPNLIDELANRFGCQCVVLAVDVKRDQDGYWVYAAGGRQRTEREALAWCAEGAARGAGEILLTSMDADGTRAGFDLDLTALISERVALPLIASGGAGQMADFAAVFEQTQADAALAAGIFHFGQVGIPALKNYLLERQIPIRDVAQF